MKAKDIKPGVVYGYRRGKYGTVTPIVFLAPVDKDHLYATASHHRKAGTPAYVKAGPNSKPGHSTLFSGPTIGYPAITGEYAATADNVPAKTLADFEAATSHYIGEEGWRFQVITSLTGVIGPYEDVRAAEAAQREADRAQRAADEKRRQAGSEHAATLVKKFAAAGVVVAADNDWQPSGLVIDFDNADKLITLLSSSEEG
jgi:hypothetical protein